MVAYYFVKSSMSGTTLARLIETVIQNVLAAGFDVVASVCDSASKNDTAIKTLTRKSEKYWALNNKPEYDYIYDIPIDNGENMHRVVHVFDAPYLQKSIRNNVAIKMYFVHFCRNFLFPSLFFKLT